MDVDPQTLPTTGHARWVVSPASTTHWQDGTHKAVTDLLRETRSGQVGSAPIVPRASDKLSPARLGASKNAIIGKLSTAQVGDIEQRDR